MPYKATRLRAEQAPTASGDLARDKRTREQAGITETTNDGMEQHKLGRVGGAIT